MILVNAIVAFSQEEARLMRFPAIHNDQVVFTYAGDLYTVDKSGGMARKLTTDLGYEMFARFSPDGKKIAFTGQYDGNTEVYIMPAQGGKPKRISITATLNRDDVGDRMGPNNIVMGWKDNEHVVYRSRKKSFNSFKGRLFLASVNGDISSEIPLACAGFCSYSPDRSKLAFNKVFREFRSWKYYQGGMAADTWIYDFNSGETEKITDTPAQDIIPMWHENKIYFISDRDRIMNLFCYDMETKETKKVTDFQEYDIKFPSIGNSSIVFENGGYIYNFDLETQEAKKIRIQIADDFNSSRREFVNANENIQSYTIAPGGNRIAYSARGEVFSVPSKTGITNNLTNTPGVHDRNVAWSPDGKYIAYISDATGEDEIYIIQKDGQAKPVQLTKNADTYKFKLKWSPDSKKILWSDKKLRLQYINIESKKITLVDQSIDWEYTRFNWSPDSKWIAYEQPNNRGNNKIFIYHCETKESKPVTEKWYASSYPVFSDDGKYLYFASFRNFKPIYSQTEWNHAYVNMSGIYFIALQKDTPSPLKPENDEVSIDQDQENQNEKKPGEKKEVSVAIDFENITERTGKIPVEGANYWNINVVNGIVYYMKKVHGDKSKLMAYDLENKKETELGQFSNYQLSPGHKKMLVRKKDQYSVIDLPKPKQLKIKEHVDLSGMKTWAEYKKEWEQIYNECWRQMKYFFYDPNMHGVDWDAVKDKYGQLIKHVNHRNDLNYLISEMIGELNVGHAYINGGDRPQPEKIKLGLLGVEVQRDQSGYYKITKILQGENWDDSKRSPLAGIGRNAKEGYYIISVNGYSTKDVNNMYELLINTAGNQVELKLNSQPQVEGAYTELIKPIADEAELYYFNWVRNNIKKVNEATDGKVGYIHIPDMGPGGLNQFVKYFYPQLEKQALIIDDRGNGGGNVSPMIIERLRRELTHMGMGRNTTATPRPRDLIYGPMVCLIDQYSASDGDLFPYQFKEHNLGKLIGQRTWGGVVGIRGSLPLLDGASLRKPEFAHFDKEGKEFIIEGHGVEPDIEVINDPAKEYKGIDQQLNKAIEVILEEMKGHPGELPGVPDFPDKSE